MRSGWKLIQIIANAEPANSADSVQTLLKGYSFSGFLDGDHSDKSSQDKKQKLCGRSF
jgi:hypothetical protein